MLHRDRGKIIVLSLVIYVNFVLGELYTRVEELYIYVDIFFFKESRFRFSTFFAKETCFSRCDIINRLRWTWADEWADPAYQLDRQSVYREGNLELFDSVPN